MRGIPNFFSIGTPVAITSSVVPVTLGTASNPFLLPVAAGQKVKCRWWIKATVGATGGIRAIIVVPAGGVLFQATYKLWNTVAPSVATAAQQASGAAFTNALANAGTHFLEIDAEVWNGTTAGNIDLQVAQNTSDALTLTVLAGGSLDTVLHS